MSKAFCIVMPGSQESIVTMEWFNTMDDEDRAQLAWLADLYDSFNIFSNNGEPIVIDLFKCGGGNASESP